MTYLHSCCYIKSILQREEASEIQCIFFIHQIPRCHLSPRCREQLLCNIDTGSSLWANLNWILWKVLLWYSQLLGVSRVNKKTNILNWWDLWLLISKHPPPVNNARKWGRQKIWCNNQFSYRKELCIFQLY